MPQKAKSRKPRVVIDTSVLVAGISGFRQPFAPGRNASADVLHRWAEKNHFVWLISEDILDEYKEVLKRLRVRSSLIGKVVNLIRERSEEVKVRSSMEISPDPKDDPFCLCAEQGKANLVITLNPTDFPQDLLNATVVSPLAMAELR
ncbi:MAG: putative toxin-antitoxin system toxin component, PIN family [Candidatus Acidiferrales bacterium]